MNENPHEPILRVQDILISKVDNLNYLCFYLGFNIGVAQKVYNQVCREKGHLNLLQAMDETARRLHLMSPTSN